MVYLDITIEQEAKALATLESEHDKKIQPKWKAYGFLWRKGNEEVKQNPNVWIL